MNQTIENPTPDNLTPGWWWLLLGDCVNPSFWQIVRIRNDGFVEYDGREWTERKITTYGLLGWTVLPLPGKQTHVIVSAAPITPPPLRDELRQRLIDQATEAFKASQ